MTIGEWFSRQYNTPPWRDSRFWSMLHVEGAVTFQVTYHLQHPCLATWDKGKPFYVFTKEQKNSIEIGGVTFEDYFTDWRSPTEKEKQMFAMLTGVELFWSETNPFRWPTEEELKESV